MMKESERLKAFTNSPTHSEQAEDEITEILRLRSRRNVIKSQGRSGSGRSGMNGDRSVPLPTLIYVTESRWSTN